MKKKIIAIFLIIFLVFCKKYVLIANNENIEYEEDEEEDKAYFEEIKNEIIQTSANITKVPNINSKAAIVIDRESKRVLYSKNINEKRAMASTTKIMTCIIALENANLDETITISKEASIVGGSTIGLSTGDKITMHDLIYGLMLCSGNDAAVQLAISIGGSEEGFSIIMNNKAKEIGLTNTNFVTPHGLDDDNHYTTAYDLAILTDYALNNKNFAKIVNTKSINIVINGRNETISNTNELLGYLNGVNGVKTGYTSNAGRCLVISCKRNEMNLISVVLGADTKKDRTKDSIRILEYAFANFSQINLKDKVDDAFEKWKRNNSINIIKGKEERIEPSLEQMQYINYPILKEENSKIDIAIECEKELEAPVLKQPHVGKLTVSMEKTKILELDLTILHEINKKDPIDYLNILWKKVHSMFFACNMSN